MKAAAGRPRARKAGPSARRKTGFTRAQAAELERLRLELTQGAQAHAARWNPDPEDVQRSVAQLVLTLVEFVRRLLERQAIRRMEGGTLTGAQVEDVGLALMTLEETVAELAARFGIAPQDLQLELGPLGKLL